MTSAVLRRNGLASLRHGGRPGQQQPVFSPAVENRQMFRPRDGTLPVLVIGGSGWRALRACGGAARRACAGPSAHGIDEPGRHLRQPGLHPGLSAPTQPATPTPSGGIAVGYGLAGEASEPDWGQSARPRRAARDQSPQRRSTPTLLRACPSHAAGEGWHG